MSCRAFNFLSQRRRLSKPRTSGGKLRAIGTLLKTNIILPALISHRTAEPGTCGIVPPRLQSLTIFLFLTINVILCCVKYEAFEGNLL